ncbi:MAG: hypothetical protein ABR557_12650 [Pyrinomonadaceae bacterium]
MAPESFAAERCARPDPRKMIVAHDFKKPGVVMQNDDVKVTTCLVRHPPIKQSYAYPFDAKDRSVVISGVTADVPSWPGSPKARMCWCTK